MIIAVVPAYNEEKIIGSVIRDLFNQVDKVVVVDDGSKDNTVQVAEKAGAEVLVHDINRGQGAALQTGHEQALKLGADYVVDFDGDGQFDSKDIERALLFLQEKQAEVLLGSRFLGTESKIPFSKKYFLFPLARIINRIFGGPKVSEAHNGFRIYTKKALEKIIINQDRMAHATEILSLIKKYKLVYVEFPVKVIYHEYGQGVGGGIQVVKDLIWGRFLK